MSSPPASLLQVDGLRVSFAGRGGPPWRRAAPVRAVDGASFELPAGRTLGLIGESGCGKSTLARALLRLVPAESGRVSFDGLDLLSLPPGRMRRTRRHMQMVFQDPGGSLDPRLRVRDAVAEPMLVHRLARGRALRQRVDDLLGRCGLDPALGARRPRQLSGGQRQRVAIARAIAVAPRLLVCDEPTSSLDVSIQAQVLNLLKDLQRDLGLACLFISHDMAVVAHMCDRIAVMDQGRIVETGARQRIIEAPAHPCTRRLLAAVPSSILPQSVP